MPERSALRRNRIAQADEDAAAFDGRQHASAAFG